MFEIEALDELTAKVIAHGVALTTMARDLYNSADDLASARSRACEAIENIYDGEPMSDRAHVAAQTVLAELEKIFGGPVSPRDSPS